MNCPKCGGVNDAGSRYCEHCGADLTKVADPQGWVGMGATGQPPAPAAADPVQENPLNPRPNRPIADAAAAAAAQAQATGASGSPTNPLGASVSSENPLNPRPVHPAAPPAGAVPPTQPPAAVKPSDLPPTDPNWQMAPAAPIEEEIQKKRRWWVWAIGILLGLCVIFCVGSYIFFEYTDKGQSIVQTAEAGGTQTAVVTTAVPGSSGNASEATSVPTEPADNLPPTKAPAEATPGA